MILEPLMVGLTLLIADPAEPVFTPDDAAMAYICGYIAGVTGANPFDECKAYKRLADELSDRVKPKEEKGS